MSLRRFLAFARRFAPLWMIWLLIILVPATREVWQLHTLGSPLVRLYDQSWRQSFGRGREFNGFRAAQKKPRDLKARLWRFSLMMQNLKENSEKEIPNTDGYDTRDSNSNYIWNFYAPQKLLGEAQAIEKAFPNEQWLRALAVHVLVARMDAWPAEKNAIQRGVFKKSRPDNEFLDGISDKSAREFLRVVQNAARFEPENAYYALVEAEIRRQNHDFAAMWNALNRAAKCKVFETHDLEIARAVVAAHEAIRPLLLEEKNEIWRANNGSSDRDFGYGEGFLSREGRAALARKDHRRAVAIAAILASVGDLMQRGTNTRAMASTGDTWKTSAWALMPHPNLKGRALENWFRHRAAHFAKYAALHGRKDVAARVPQWLARQRALFYLNDELNPGASYGESSPLMNPSKRDALARAARWRDAGGFVLLHGVFVSLFWWLSNLFLWRGAGAPSPRRDRVLPALSVLLLAVSLALWTHSQFQIIENALAANRWTLAGDMQQAAAASVGILAFFGAPFLLAVLCACATMVRHRSDFLQRARIETELRFRSRDSLLLRCGATVLCALSVAAAFGFYGLWLLLVGLDVRSIDPLGWLPLDRKGQSYSYSMPAEVLLAPLIIYCLFLSFLGFLLWFIKWRYFGGKDNRALTHGGLRRWKESLGAYLVLVSALYFAVALCGWPTRAQASRELEIRIARGELAR